MGNKRKFGQVRPLPSGRWQARYWLDAESHKAPNTFVTKGEADSWLDAEERRVGQDEWTPDFERSFQAWAERWMRTPRKRRKSTADGSTSKKMSTTVSDYEAVFRNHVFPLVGDLPIHAFTLSTVLRLQKQLDKNLATKPRTNQKAQDFTSWVLNFAVRKGALRVNPFLDEEVSLPDGQRKRQPLEFEVEDLEHLLRVIDPHFKMACYVAAYFGLRAGELWALKRNSIDLARKRLFVTQAVKEETGRGLVLRPPKNGMGRVIGIPDSFVGKFEEYLSETKGSDDDWLFRGKRGHQVRQTNFMSRVFYPAREAAGLSPSLRFHDLRHYCAHFWISLGANVYQIKELMGHSSINVTMDLYGGQLDSGRRELAARFDTWAADRVTSEAQRVLSASPIKLPDYVSSDTSDDTDPD